MEYTSFNKIFTKNHYAVSRVQKFPTKSQKLVFVKFDDLYDVFTILISCSIIFQVNFLSLSLSLSLWSTIFRVFFHLTNKSPTRFPLRARENTQENALVARSISLQNRFVRSASWNNYTPFPPSSLACSPLNTLRHCNSADCTREGRALRGGSRRMMNFKLIAPVKSKWTIVTLFRGYSSAIATNA